MARIIEFHSVSKRYRGGFDALSDVSFVMEQGEMVFLTGRSGAGKSTLLKLVACLERPSKGQIIINGKNLGALRTRNVARFRQQLGIIFQNFKLLYDRTVYDNVALPLIIRGLPASQIGRRVRAALDTVGLLDKERQYPVTLSGGEQQRVGIARAIVTKPPLLLADEPTGNLDPGLSQEIMQLFERFNRVGVSLLIASHDLRLIRRLDHRMVTLDHGRIVDAGA